MIDRHTHSPQLARRRALSRSLAAVLLLPALAGGGEPDRPPVDPPQGRFDDIWMVILLSGQRVGYVHGEKFREGDLIRSRSKMRLLLKRAGLPLELTLDNESLETVGGVPRGFRITEQFSAYPLTKSGTIADGQITLVTEQFGKQSQQVLSYPAGTLMDWGTHLRLLREEPTPGKTLNLNVYVPAQSLTGGVPTTIEVQEREQIEVLGRLVPAIRTRTIADLSGNKIESIAWIDEHWTPIKERTTLLNMTLEMVVCDQAEALRDLGGAEMFINTLIPVGQHIDRNRAQSITYVITGAADGQLPDLPDTAMQKVVSRDARSMTIRVARQDHARLRTAPVQPPPPNFEEFLESSAFVTSADEAVVAMARRAAGSETQPYALATRFTQTVADEIDSKDLGTAFATAAEVCRQKTGDCTEHGVLLAALGRVCKIPTRVVTGLIYVEHLGGRDNLMGFHMWTQYWIAGEWVDLDAAWEQVDVDPTHITLGTHSTQHGAVGSLVSSGILKMSNLDIKIADIQYTP